MKRKIQSLLFLFWPLLSTNVFAEDITNVFYPEESENNFHYMTLSEEARREFDARLRADAIKAGECRRAELDLEGHWGRTSLGFQLSIRSKTNVFAVGSPIPVATIIRNTTTNTLSLPSVSAGMEVGFTIKDETDQPVDYDSRKFFISGSGHGFRAFAPKHQIKTEYDLNRQFSLKPGTYKIHAERRVVEVLPGNRINSFTNLSSDVLVIKIVPK